MTSNELVKVWNLFVEVARNEQSFSLELFGDESGSLLDADGDEMMCWGDLSDAINELNRYITDNIGANVEITNLDSFRQQKLLKLWDLLKEIRAKDLVYLGSLRLFADGTGSLGDFDHTSFIQWISFSDGVNKLEGFLNKNKNLDD